ncbi:Estradiol 17 beta-dehydrogenase 5 [Wickerhamomyces ciferrii]|uniref:Estradiol 17 beta-dehydrogenase 5 n=1 Tax=Wickerhamomyces ciferrii (strain ATCC 14091 / BCRC 22168 / CBS 111 / JCM 3599 / NBRC 0793 / NRRL Y-1031 F-60-10) TaxID=1206466 RepID=K0KKX2_WICCF|nr:Estradiol 17 beta-dehydrogenase 5 [Wickerhamomyces ciferrii]CCH43661.1 Estradiol 17 beta-dehydrogenase 5 [Wickerhamomyces ciferrii]
MSSENIIEWNRLGKSGLKISKVIIGFMSYGSKDWAEWVEDDEEKIFRILKKAYDMGIRTYDTADFYSNGVSEIILGKFLKKYDIKRDKVVILNKVFFPIDEDLDLRHTGLGPHVNSIDLVNSRGLSRKHIIDGVEGCVKRLGTYIDVLQIHRLDPETTGEEIMRSLNTIVEKGYTRYIGASSMRATDFVELQHIAENHGWHKFISMQNYYNLLYREEEREMIPYCNKSGVGLVPWSPNARGILTRPIAKTTDRIKSDPTFVSLGLNNLSETDKEIVNRVEEISKKRGVSMAIVSNAWVISKGASPIIGLNSEDRVEEAVAATKFKLTEEETKYLEEPYQPKRVLGHS